MSYAKLEKSKIIFKLLLMKMIPLTLGVLLILGLRFLPGSSVRRILISFFLISTIKLLLFGTRLRNSILDRRKQSFFSIHSTYVKNSFCLCIWIRMEILWKGMKHASYNAKKNADQNHRKTLRKLVWITCGTI